MNLSSIQGLVRIVVNLLLLSLTQCGIRKEPQSEYNQKGPHTHLYSEEEKKKP